jgi:hypothetical protein
MVVSKLMMVVDRKTKAEIIKIINMTGTIGGLFGIDGNSDVGGGGGVGCEGSRDMTSVGAEEIIVSLILTTLNNDNRNVIIKN